MPEPGQEHQETSTAGASITPDNEPASSHDEGSNPSPEGDSGEGSGWGSAKSAFYKDGPLDDFSGALIGDDEDASDPEEADGETDSHLEDDPTEEDPEAEETESDESEVEDLLNMDVKYNLDDLHVPHKYKPEVQKKIDAILAKSTEKFSKTTEAFKESNGAFASAFVKIINSDNPMKTLQEYAKEAAPVFKFTPEVIDRLSKQTGDEPPASRGEETQTPTLDPKAFQERVNQELAKIEDKYWQQLDKETDPARSRKLFSDMQREQMALIDAVNSAKQKAVLTAFFNKLIKPKFDEFGKLSEDSMQTKATAERSIKVGMWNTADSKMKEAHPDWPKYKAKVKELIKTRYKGVRDEVNSSGKGHLELMKDIYLAVSRKDHFEKAKKPLRGPGGFKPNGKHIKTQKAGGSDWKSIKQAHFGDLIPDDE